MRQDAGRDRLEELQRRPRDHQHVEDEAGRGGALEAADDQRPGVEEGLFAEHDQEDGGGEAGAPLQGEILTRLRRSQIVIGAGCGFLLRHVLRHKCFGFAPSRRIRLRRSVAPPCGASGHAGRVPLHPLRPAEKCEGHDHEAERRGGQDADRDRRLAAQQADRDEHGEDGAEARFGEDQGDEEAEALGAGEEAAGEVAGGVEEDGAEEDPVERFVALQQVVLDRPAQGQREDREGDAEAELDRRRDAHRPADLLALRPVFGDVAREQLFDRPVEGRDRDEDRRPEHRDLPVVGLREDVRGDQEVGVGDQPREADADREEARQATVLGGRRSAFAALHRPRS